jgi:predicted aspartyl protease
MLTSTLAVLSYLVIVGLGSFTVTADRPAARSTHRLRLTASLPLVLVELTPDERVWFALDTGAAGTTVTPELADRLGLTPVTTAAITTLAGRATVGVVLLPSVRVVGRPERVQVHAAVHDLTELRRLAPDAEGILGQDVLARYDYLIDYARARLELGTFEPPPQGVALPLTWSGGRPVVHLRGRDATHGFVLDSAANALFVDAAAATDALGTAPPLGLRRATMRTHVGEAVVMVELHGRVDFTGLPLPGLELVRLPATLWPHAPEVGLLPTTVFSQVYVSARTARASLWPRRQ